jgi:hypothetical protein
MEGRARRNCRARFFSVDGIVVERPGFALAGQPRRLSLHEPSHLQLPDISQ